MVVSLKKHNQSCENSFSQLSRFYGAKETNVLTKALVEFFSSLQKKSDHQQTTTKIAIGLSGGADSSMLLAVLAPLVKHYNLSLHILHVHHGLMKDADAWAAHCQSLAAYLGFECEVIKVVVDSQSGLGEEAAARMVRYDAYKKYCQQHEIHKFILAHHLNDQAETILLRLLRGTGVRGMGGMSASHDFEGVRYYRPWLTIDRKVITDAASRFTELSGLAMIQDPSNLDIRYKRAAVRRLLIPGLNKAWPQWKQHLARHARLMNDAQALLDEVAKNDLLTLDPREKERSFCLASWRQLSQRRQANVLRYWLTLYNIQMPTERRINDWLRQLREVHQLGYDRALRLKHQSWLILVKQGRVRLVDIVD